MKTFPRLGHAIRQWWPLTQELDFLNAASFGATPHSVLAAQSVWRDRMEREPVDFFIDDLGLLLREQAEILAQFVGADAQRLVFVENATSGVQTAVSSHLRARRAGLVDNKKGNSRKKYILTTTQVYPAVRHMLQVAARDFNLEYREVSVPFPSTGAEEVYDIVRGALNSDCEVLVIDHVASPTGLIFPIERIVAAARDLGVATVVDGAHAPGMLALNLAELGVDWYTGNCHKWMFAPKGCALLYAAEHCAEYTHPTIISLGYGRGMAAEFDYVGTRDYSAYLSIGSAIDFIHSLDVAAMRRHQQEIISDLRARCCTVLEIADPAPAEMTAGMLALPLAAARRSDSEAVVAMRSHVRRNYKVEVPFIAHENQMLIRPAAQVFNEKQDYDRLVELLEPRTFNRLQDELGWI